MVRAEQLVREAFLALLVIASGALSKGRTSTVFTLCDTVESIRPGTRGTDCKICQERINVANPTINL
jgi:hypothetical protein